MHTVLRLAAAAALTLARAIAVRDSVPGETALADNEGLLTALAQVAPLEFLRRAAEGEQATLQLRRVDPSTSPRCVVLLDAPPSQHGAPRLVHLALLVVLATRAGRGGLPLAWGLLQGEHLAEGVDVDDLEAWRHGARWGPGTPADLERWRDVLQLAPDDELWLIGGPELPDDAGARRLEVTEPVRTDGQLRLRWGRKELWLPPVPDREGTRLFRRPPRRRPRPRLGAGNHSGRCWFGVSGDRLFVPLDDGRVIAYHVPNSPAAAQKGPGRPRIIGGEGLVAAGMHRRRLLSVRIEGDVVTVRPGDHVLPRPLDLVPPEGPVLARAFADDVCFVDGAGQLWGFPSGKLWASDVIAFDRDHVLVDVYGPPERRWWGRDTGTPLSVSTVDGAVMSQQGAALRTAPTTWWLGGPIRLPEGARVGGPMFRQGGPGLVWWAAGEIVWQDHEGPPVVLHRARDVVDLAVHPSRSIVAWCHRDGRIVAWEMEADVELLRVTPGEGEAS